MAGRRLAPWLVAAVIAGCVPVTSGPAPSPSSNTESPAAVASATRGPVGSPMIVALPQGAVIDVDRVRDGAKAIGARNGLELLAVSTTPGGIAFRFDKDVPSDVRPQLLALLIALAPSPAPTPVPSGVAVDAELIARRMIASVVLLHPQRGLSGGGGAGFFISGDGYLLTNAHVAKELPFPLVTLYDGRELNGRLVGYVESGNPDVAVIKVDFSPPLPFELGDSDAIRAGDTVLKIGHGAGHGNWLVAGGRLLPSGTVPAVHIRADVPGAPGDSGGPMFDLRGRVIGIVYGAAFESSPGSSPGPFRIVWSWSEYDSLFAPPVTDAVPINLARAKVAEIIARQGNVP